MSTAKKSSDNPYFEMKYADLNSIRAAVMPALNANGISVIQPITMIDGIDYVETILLHESGEYISSITRIMVDKANNAQRHGSGISYARRYALQCMVCIGAEDDDANAATAPAATKAASWMPTESMWDYAKKLIENSTADDNGRITADNMLTNAKTKAAWDKIINRLVEIQIP